MSTPILWLAVKRIGTGLPATVLANLIGGAIFFWVDRFIFTSSAVEVWHIKEGRCDKCGAVSYLWRLVRTAGYDRNDSQPVFLCLKCSKQKTEELRARGISVNGKSR